MVEFLLALSRFLEFYYVIITYAASIVIYVSNLNHYICMASHMFSPRINSDSLLVSSSVYIGADINVFGAAAPLLCLTHNFRSTCDDVFMCCTNRNEIYSSFK